MSLSKFISKLLNDQERVRRLSREGGWIVFGQITTVIGTLALVRVLTEHLEPSQYGQLALGITIAGLMNQVVTGGIVNGTSRFYSIAAELGDLREYLKASAKLNAYATLVICLIALVMIVILLWMGYFKWINLALAVLFFSILSGYNSSLSGIQNAARQRSIVAFHNGMNAWLKIVFCLCLIYWIGSSSTIVVIGYVLSILLVTGSQFFFLWRLIKKQAFNVQRVKDTEWLPRILSYSLPFSYWGLFTWAQMASDRWALEAFVSTQDVGQYAVVYQLGYTPIALFTGMIVSFLGPIFYQKSGDATNSLRNIFVHRMAWRITIMSMAATGGIFVFAFLMHDWLFHFLVAEQYRNSSYFLPWMVLSGGLFSSSQVIGLKMMSEMKVSSLIKAKIITAIFGIGFNIFGAMFFGIVGVVSASVAFSLFCFVWMACLSKKVYIHD